MQTSFFFGVTFMLLVAVGCNNGEEVTKTEPTKPTQKGVLYSDTFRNSFNSMLEDYYRLKDAFVAADTASIRTAAVKLKETFIDLSIKEAAVKDSLAYASVEGRPGDVIASLDGLLAEKDIEKQRESFEMISMGIYDLVMALRPSGIHVYHQNCPMAFNDKGASWLSSADSIMNPYFGKKMLHCGEVKEELIFK